MPSNAPRVRERTRCVVCHEPVGSRTCRTIVPPRPAAAPEGFAFVTGLPVIEFPAPRVESPVPSPKPAEVFPVGKFIEDELAERGWTRESLAERAGVNKSELDALIDSPQRGVRISNEFAAGLATAFGTSSRIWISLDNQWQDW